MSRKALAAVAAVVLLCGAYFVTRGSENGPPDPSMVRPAKVERGTLRLSVAATGEVRPLRQIELKSKASGEVVGFPKREGDAVAIGDRIAELDRRTEQRNLLKAQADLNTSLAQLLITALEYRNALQTAQSEFDSSRADAVSKKSELERLKGLGDSVSEKELGEARLAALLADEKLKKAQAALVLARDRKAADARLAQARLTQAAVAYEEALDRLRDTQVRSPIRGILLQQLVEEGQIVSSGLSAASGGTPVAVVADTSVMIVEANVDETDIGRVKVGQRAEITVDAHRERTFPGEVDLIRPLGQIDSNIVVFKVRIAVQGPDLHLLLSVMTANVEIIYKEIPDALMVPAEVVKRDGKGTHVFVPDGPGRRRVDVKTGLDNGAKVQILEGLKDGQEILIVHTPDPEQRRGRW